MGGSSQTRGRCRSSCCAHDGRDVEPLGLQAGQGVSTLASNTSWGSGVIIRVVGLSWPLIVARSLPQEGAGDGSRPRRERREEAEQRREHTRNDAEDIKNAETSFLEWEVNAVGYTAAARCIVCAA